MNNSTNSVTVTYTVGETSYELCVRQKIPYTDLRTAIKTAVDAVFLANEGAYEPTLKPYVVNYAIIKYYTDYSGSYDVDEFMELTEYGDLLTNVLNVVNTNQINQLRKIIDEEIEYRNSRSEIDLFFKDARVVLKKWDSKLSKAFKPRAVEKLIKNLSETKIPEKTILDAVIDHVDFKQGAKK